MVLMKLNSNAVTSIVTEFRFAHVAQSKFTLIGILNADPKELKQPKKQLESKDFTKSGWLGHLAKKN